LSSGRVVCIGAATRDTIFRVPRHPRADDRVVASEFVVAGGGTAATAAVTLARLGVETSLIGTVGDDDAGAEIRAGLEREGVDVSCLRVVAGARSWQSTVLVGDGTRAIVTTPGPEVALDERGEELCRAADWVHVDHAGYAAAPRDVRLSIDGGNPIPDLDLRGVALYAPTERTLRETFPGGAEDALAAGAELVVVTRGAGGSSAWSRSGEHHAEAAGGEIVSTLGAGDVFHGALLAELVRGTPIDEALVCANRCAALSCRALDGRSAIPTADEL
jgi:sugar/nucleoside kinase (ribokinase family)